MSKSRLLMVLRTISPRKLQDIPQPLQWTSHYFAKPSVTRSPCRLVIVVVFKRTNNGAYQRSPCGWKRHNFFFSLFFILNIESYSPVNCSIFTAVAAAAIITNKLSSSVIVNNIFISIDLWSHNEWNGVECGGEKIANIISRDGLLTNDIRR